MIVVLADASAFRPGSAIRLTMTNAASLGRHIHADRADPGTATFKECPNFMDWIAWVTAVDGGRVTLDRPLRLDIGTRFVHDLTVEGLANGNVFSKGRTVQMTFDHHANMPYENLFTDIDAGDPLKLWVSGGRNDRGPHTGARSTFWNIRTKGSAAPLPDWPMMNLIGVRGYSSDRDKDGSWIEKLSGVVPPDLHEAQRARRLSGQR